MAATETQLEPQTLLAVLPFPEPEGFASRMREKYPHLEIVWVHQAYGKTTWDVATTFDPALFQNATILCTLSAIPTPEQAPKLRFIQLLPAGVDHLFEEPIFQKPDVQIATTSGIHAPQIAEWVILQILFFSRHQRYFEACQTEGSWVSHSEIISSQGTVRDMTTYRVGILGYGSIGRQVARVCHSMGSTILAFTTSSRNTSESRHDDGFCLPGTGDPKGLHPAEWYSGLDKSAVHEFLRQNIDVLVITLPLTDQTKDLLGPEEFAILGQQSRDGKGPGTMLVNVSRGSIVVQDALVESLKKPVEEGGLRCAALDVTDPEPLPSEHELWRLPNVVLHPHASALTDQRTSRFLSVLEENISRWSKGKTLMNLVEKRRGY